MVTTKALSSFEGKGGGEEPAGKNRAQELFASSEKGGRAEHLTGGLIHLGPWEKRIIFQERVCCSDRVRLLRAV